MATVEVVCYKYRPLKNGELPLKIKVCKDRKTRYINLGVSTKSENWEVFLPNLKTGILRTTDQRKPVLIRKCLKALYPRI